MENQNKYTWKWTSSITNIDIDTGEVLTKHQTKKYKLIKTIKDATIITTTISAYHTNKGEIHWTKFWARNKQGNLFP